MVLLGALGLIGYRLLNPTAPAEAVPLFVSPTGSDSDDGSSDEPLQTIQAALDLAVPGTTITLDAGVYRENLHTVRAGTPDAPITIRGPEIGTDRTGRYRATLFGTDHAISIDHSHYILDGFTIDGQEALVPTPFPTEPSALDAFKSSVQDRAVNSRLVYIGSADDARDLTGITIRNMFLSGSGGECVRLRNNAHDNTITGSVIQYCGVYAKGSGGSDFHNGEGVYIGTSPKSSAQPLHDHDGSSNNTVSDNVIRTFGTECLDVKENAHHNVFENNDCSDNTESTYLGGSNVELRGFGNTVRGNTISRSAGYHIKIQSDVEADDTGDNTIVDNRLAGAAGPALLIKSSDAQGPICGNEVIPPGQVGSGIPADPTAPCSDGARPS